MGNGSKEYSYDKYYENNLLKNYKENYNKKMKKTFENEKNSYFQNIENNENDINISNIQSPYIKSNKKQYQQNIYKSE